ncbi:putative ubiquitinyl hydrolase 1 [Helianthus annuus]|uniref:ubiquitinyl hydrolase 1 n=1 Tax=Helianthus annuus TaxID=4232 RepID=A0A251SP77_HELAN|nr:ubiquitin carboxyl-terminal hydrolase 15 isoform X1 [Helianthus annuus]XP_021999968.1 ubiquitin carboxyl-terminal hydrolase 15 isoform X1 [Helianthus annuus]XP_035837405.1 ubiquitin carboxyl-terminal hydrolase 15 isoform X1 [Helianthus annuus]KAF5771836.1 putative ubiquitinyl hydrolase 1 [Helianthus annuus]KAJ0496351.1 putative ubiquitinyl hydrolase 1 [Helianthus annuus]
MLQPRQTDLPFLFLVLVVLPLAAYVLLGKWGDFSKKKVKISELAQIAAEEAFRAEAMAAAAVIPLVPVLKLDNGFHQCARCFGPAKTRCSRCKSARYCSGKCQIVHWRQGHKQECQLLEYNSSCASPNSEEFVDEQFLSSETLDFQFSESNFKQFHEKAASRSSSFNLYREMSRKEENVVAEPSVDTCSTSYDKPSSKGTFVRHKQPKRGRPVPPKEEGNGTNSLDVERELVDGWSERSHAKKCNTVKSTSHSLGATKSTAKWSRDQICPKRECMDQVDTALEDSRVGDVNPPHEGSGIVNKGFMKMIGLKRSSKHDRVERVEVNSDKHNKKIKMLFPYEEFVKFFQYEAFNLLPRGLINCGNSCYANAVLQCLTSTKPLTVYLLRQSHSKSCGARSWCLICELERHVLLLRDNGDPLSLSKILLNMRAVNNKMGDGSQEDAHEFLRLLVTLMQSICLEGFGGESVNPKLQETTFIQHTFGGQLRSKVKCLRCNRESDRYENIMDLTLEIFGWVESLEDALTQFTSLEELDGENMYRCARCAAYVPAQKQLAIQEAPNILTIVLKRFQEGSYGKINKCITFPDMLDMIPYMTGTDDVPPLYMLYSVVVHLDTMNASFSGHYISYVKDLQGNWFRIDDTQVQPVPLSQVMSEGAYILFYMRSSPRLLRMCTAGKPKASRAPKSTSGQETVSNRNQATSCVDFSDAASSDWSIFTSSDDASFTTESTRDSFSTIDNTDNNLPYVPPDYSVSCGRFSRSRPHLISKLYHGCEPPYRI